jgi:large subunit ribosomal protein L15
MSKLELHKLKSGLKVRRKRKRVGRGGKRGTYSGRGLKGQKSRSGGKSGLKQKGLQRTIRQMPKTKGFRSKKKKAVVVKLSSLSKFFQTGETVSPLTLAKAGLINDNQSAVKILSTGKVTKSLKVKNCDLSTGARKAIEEAGGEIN